MEKVIIAEASLKGDWYNLKDNNGREISCFVGNDKNGKPSNPGLKTKLSTVKAGEEVEMDVKVGKDGVKLFAWDPKGTAGGGFGGKTFASKDKSFEAGIAAAQAAATMLSLKKEVTTSDFDSMFEHIHGKIMGKTAK